MDQWEELLRNAALNVSEINEYWLQFHPISQTSGALVGAFMIVISIASLIGNFMMAIHSVK